MQGSFPMACGDLGFCLFCVGECLFFQHQKMTVELGVDVLHPREERLGQFNRGKFRALIWAEACAMVMKCRSVMNGLEGRTLAEG